MSEQKYIFVLAYLEAAIYGKLASMKLESEEKIDRDKEFNVKVKEIIKEVYKDTPLTNKQIKEYTDHLRKFWVITLKKEL